MGYAPAHLIERAAKYLLSLLHEQDQLQYSKAIYDGSDEKHEELMRALGLENDQYSAEGLVDLAASQLEEQGILKCETLESRLADGENDFLIKWAEGGDRIDQTKLRFYAAE